MRSGQFPKTQTRALDLICIVPAGPVPLAVQLSQQLEALISSELLQEGERLPPVRELAQRLGIHWHTVRGAYRRLQEAGLVEMGPGRGTCVRAYDAYAVQRSSARAPSFSIGVVIPGLNPFYIPFLRGLQDAARDGPWLIYPCFSFNNAALASRYFNELAARGVDGLILAAGSSPAADAWYAQRQPGAPPVVWVDQPEKSGHAVLLDSRYAAYVATQHLLEHGHRRIALIGGLLTWRNLHDCYVGYRRALRQAGLEVEQNLVCEAPDFTLGHGGRAAERLLALPEPPTAIFGAADILSIGAMRAIQARGLRVPEDMAIASYNDIDLAALVDPPLTTVTGQSYEMGLESMRMLQRLIAGERVESQRVTLRGSLVVRRSCGCSP